MGVVTHFITGMVLVFARGMCTFLPRATLWFTELRGRCVGVFVSNTALSFFLMRVVAGIPTDMVLILTRRVIALHSLAALGLIELLGGSLCKRKACAGQKGHCGH
jgi:hypothetical protein